MTPLPRTRSAAVTRETILDAAARRFAEEGYDDVTLREVAGDAGVDPALVVRYFGSKEDLFAAALDCCDGDDWLDGPRETFGERMARELVYSEQPEDFRRLQIMLRSASSAKAQEIVQRVAAERFYGPLAAWLGEPDGAVRARLVAALMMGMELKRDLAGGLKLTPEECERVRTRLAAMLQALVDC